MWSLFAQGLIPFFLCGLTIPLLRSRANAQGTNQVRPWHQYEVIMWIGDSAYKDPARLPLFFQRLREMGITAGMVHGDGNLGPVLDNAFPYYVENMVNRGLCLKWNSKVQDWESFVTKWVKDGRPESALVRDYCLDDPDWRAWANREMQRLVTKNRGHRPLAYDIRDELSTTISANPFDFDFNPAALAAFRDWLKKQYATLPALNAEWETAFVSWDEVKPFTTDQIKARMATGQAMPRARPDWRAVQSIKFEAAAARQRPTAWNFSPWADFRTYMDISLARALEDLRHAAHELDPLTPVGIEGTQMPHAFGGYDLWRLSQVLDWVEPYDIGNAREIFGSFMPGKAILTTVFETETNPASRRLWHLLLEGDRGCIIWWSEDCIDWRSPDYPLTQKAKALRPVLKEMTSPLARLFLRAQRERDPVFIQYSQPSIQVDWLLESTVDGSTWLRRFSSFEAAHNRMAKTRNGWLKAFQDLGLSPQFISSEQIERGELPTHSVLVLADCWAMSEREAAAIRSHLESGASNTVFCEGAPGLFDQHGRLQAEGALEHLIPASQTNVLALLGGGHMVPGFPGGAQYASDRLRGKTNWVNWVSSQLGDLKPAVAVTPLACIRAHRFRLGNRRLLALERNADYHMSEELKQAGGNEALEKPVDIEVTLPESSHIYDLWTGEYLGHRRGMRVRVDPWKPSLFALTREKLNGDAVAVLGKE